MAMIRSEHAAKIGVFLLLVLAIFCVPTRSFAQNIEGTYDLYDAEHLSAGVVNTMTIYNQSGNRFLIRGDGWSGTGQISGGGGYYDWKFTDGKSGRTTISVRSDGTIEGRVQGPGGRELNWPYIAKPTSRPQTGCLTPGQPYTRDAWYFLPFSNRCDRDVYVAVCAINVNGKNPLGWTVPARGSVDITIGNVPPILSTPWSETNRNPCGL